MNGFIYPFACQTLWFTTKSIQQPNGHFEVVLVQIGFGQVEYNERVFQTVRVQTQVIRQFLVLVYRAEYKKGLYVGNEIFDKRCATFIDQCQLATYIVDVFIALFQIRFGPYAPFDKCLVQCWQNRGYELIVWCRLPDRLNCWLYIFQTFQIVRFFCYQLVQILHGYPQLFRVLSLKFYICTGFRMEMLFLFLILLHFKDSLYAHIRTLWVRT